MDLHTLIFNSTTKTVVVTTTSQFGESQVLYNFENVPTVKVREEGCYEVYRKETKSDGMESTYPVARFPIQNTHMIIEK